jgi:hypothetical protein
MKGVNDKLTRLGSRRVAAAMISLSLQLPADAGLPRQLIPRALMVLEVAKMATKVISEECIVK